MIVPLTLSIGSRNPPTLNIPQGATVTFTVTAYRQDGVTPVDLTLSGTSISMSVRKSPTQAAVLSLAFVAAPLQGKGVATAVQTPDLTKRLLAGAYLYDVWLTTNNARDALCIPGAYNLMAALTPPP